MQEELLAEGSERAGDVSIREEEAAGKMIRYKPITFYKTDAPLTLTEKSSAKNEGLDVVFVLTWLTWSVLFKWVWEESEMKEYRNLPTE